MPNDENCQLQRIADLAPNLKEAELRVLLALAAIAHGDPPTAKASSRQIAQQHKITRNAVQHAIDTLNDRAIITTIPGTTKISASYVINALSTTSMGGYFTEPRVATLQSQGGSFREPPLDPKQAMLQDPRARVDSIDLTTDTIDRVLKASPKKTDPEDLKATRDLMYGYMRKLGRLPEPHPPDANVVSQLLAVAPAAQIATLLHNLWLERITPGERYAWFVTVALQRIHGIAAGDLKRRRAELSLVRQGKPAAAEQQAELDPDWSRDLVATTAKAKAL